MRNGEKPTEKPAEAVHTEERPDIADRVLRMTDQIIAVFRENSATVGECRLILKYAEREVENIATTLKV